MTITEALDAAARKRVLFVGETIIDVYHYVRLLGKPVKEPMLSAEFMSTETFEGGVKSTADQARIFGSHIDVHSPRTVRKERYVEHAHIRKLFEVYWHAVDHQKQHPEWNTYDAVIVTDYGHGMFDKALAEEICSEAKWLAVNVQANSGNFGFNLATKYPGANYLCVDELEARLATQNQHGPLFTSITELCEIAETVVVTIGREGATGFDRKGARTCKAFTDRVVDTMGAGDAFFAVTALVADTLPLEDLLRLGNAAGAAKAQIVGHRSVATKEAILDYLKGA